MGFSQLLDFWFSRRGRSRLGRDRREPQKLEVPRDGIEPPTRGFSERPRARPPPFVEAPFYLYVINITSIINIHDLSWIELK
jgi:hypothetical protein